MSEDSNKLAGSDDHDIMLLPDLAKEIEAKLEDNSSSTRTQINLKPKLTQVGTPLAQPIFGLRNSESRSGVTSGLVRLGLRPLSAGLPHVSLT